jgi:hypothetical protein
VLNPALTAHWKIDPATVEVRLFSFPDGAMAVPTMWWLLQRFPHENIVDAKLENCPLPVARNIVAGEFLNHDKPWLLMVDRDVIPDHRTDYLFTQEDMPDLACCAWDPCTSHWHADRTIWHMSFALIHRKVLEGLEKPWFKMELSEDGYKATCDCHYFSQKARAAGFTTGNCGVAGHKSSRAWCGR